MAAERLHVYELLERHYVPGPGRAYKGAVASPGGPLALGTAVRVRVVDVDAAGGPDGIQRLVRAHGAARGAASESVHAPADFGTLRGEPGLRFWSAMAWLPGTSMDVLLDETPVLSDEATEGIARDLASALAALHGTGLAGIAIHPATVLLHEEGRAVLLDVGFAPVDLRVEGAPAPLAACLAPEVRADVAERGHASDLYALGALLYRAATGSFYDNERTVDGAEPGSRRPNDVRHAASIFLSEVIHTLLDPRPGRRFSSANELVQVLAGRRQSAWWMSRHIQQESVVDDPVSMLAATRDPPPPPVTPPAEPPDEEWFTERPAPLPLGDRHVPCVSRTSQLAALRAAVDATTAGTGGVVVVRGSFGAGRTRVLDALLESVEQRTDIIALAATFPRYGVGRPLGALTEALTHFMTGEREVQEQLVARLLGESAGAATTLAAILSSRAGPPGAEALGLSALCTCFVRVVETITAHRPALLVLDDVDRAGTAARRVIGALARVTADMPLLIVVACSALPTDLAESFAGRAEVVIDSLDAFAMLDLVRAVVGDDTAAAEIAPIVHDASGGRPRPAYDVLHALAARGVLERVDATRFTAGDAPLSGAPNSEQSAFAARLQAVGDRGRQLLFAAALQGDRFDGDVTRRTLDWTHDEMESALADVEAAGLVRGEGPARRFVVSAHTGLLTTGADPGQLAAAHVRTADAFLASRNPDQLAPSEIHGVLAYRVAYHYLRGGSVLRGELYLPAAMTHMRATWRLAEADRLARLAADQLRQEGRTTAAIDLDLDRAAILSRAGDVSGAREVLTAAQWDAMQADDRRRAARLSLALANVAEDPMRAAEYASEALTAAVDVNDRPAVGRAHFARGLARRDQQRYGEARHELRRALELARETRDRSLESRARRAAGQVAARAGWKDEAEDHLRSALTAARNGRDLRLETVALRGLARHALSDSDPVRAEQLLRRAVAVDRARGDGSDEAQDLIDLAGVLQSEGRVSEACALFGEAAHLAKVVGDGALRARTLRLRGESELSVGRVTASESTLRDALTVAESEPDAGEHGRVLTAVGKAAFQLGDVTRAKDLLERAMEVLAGQEHSVALARTGVALARVEMLMGAVERAEVRLRDAVEALGKDPLVAVAHSLRAVGAARSGREAVTRARADDAVHAMRDLGDVAERIEALFRLSLAARVLGDVELADERLLDAESCLHRAARRLSEDDAESFTSARSPGRDIVAGAAHLRHQHAQAARAGD